MSDGHENGADQTWEGLEIGSTSHQTPPAAAISG